VGLFAAGCQPSAAADPYGLRRIAYGMLQVRALALHAVHSVSLGPVEC
jgi:glycyl-tRNA synthetase beta subunit